LIATLFSSPRRVEAKTKLVLLKGGYHMTTLDFTPLFRSTVGFDRLSDMLSSTLSDQPASYPPYNIVKLDEDNYRITMAVAGFTEKDIEITARENELLVQGKGVGREDVKDAAYLHRGIAERAFERRFQLADHIRVTGAALENGLLTVSLVREIPEQMKPRKIEILPARTTNGKKAA
jgi:molecular chaperone IbpA